MQVVDTKWTDETVCPKCACPRLDVDYTYKRNGRRIRVRICQNCGKRVRTAEIIEQLLDNPPKRSHIVK